MEAEIAKHGELTPLAKGSQFLTLARDKANMFWCFRTLTLTDLDFAPLA